MKKARLQYYNIKQIDKESSRKKRDLGACGASQEREGEMHRGGQAPRPANDIKHGKMAVVGLAGGFWPISNTPSLCQMWFFSLPVLIMCLDSQRKKELMPTGEKISVASCLLAEVVVGLPQ
jgi:hypothetical protein